MYDFFSQNKVLVMEASVLKDRACQQLGWTEKQYWYRSTYKQQLTPAERIAMGTILNTIRVEVAEGNIDLRAYNLRYNQ